MSAEVTKANYRRTAVAIVELWEAEAEMAERLSQPEYDALVSAIALALETQAISSWAAGTRAGKLSVGMGRKRKLYE